MSSDGLHLFMDAIRAREKSKKESSESGGDLATVIELVKLTKPNRTAAEDARYENLIESLDNKEGIAPGTPTVVFNVPEHSLETWINHLIADEIRPIKNIHYKEYNSCLYANTEPQSYEQDVDDAGIQYREEQMALAANANANVNAQEGFIRTGMRNARVANLAALRHAKKWELLKRELPNDTRIEDSLLRFTDDNRRKPEWNTVILNLKRHGEANGYDTIHFKQALDRWISFFLPSMQKITENMQPGEVASLLASMHKPKPKFDILQKELMELVRHPGEDLESKLALLKSLANSMYHDFTESERIANVDRILLNGILQFTHGSTRKNAELAIEFEKRQGKHIDYESILLGALNSERVYGAPNVKLPYNTPLNPATMIYNVNTVPSDYLHGAGNVVRTDIDPAAISTPLVAETLCKSARPSNPPDLYRADLYNIQTQELIPIITQAIENYYVRPNVSSGNNAKTSDTANNRDPSKNRNDSRGRNNDSSKDRRSRYDRSKSRDSYRSSRFTSPRRDFHESDKLSGINCSKDYNPKYEFRCLKCMTENDHHEFSCKKYHRRSKFVCKNCKLGFHFHEECEKSRSTSRDRKN